VDTPQPTLRIERIAVLLFGVACVVAGLWPWPIEPTTILGEAAGEMDQHMAMLWNTLAGDEAWLNWPEGFTVPVQDKLHLPLAWLLFKIDPAAVPAGLVAFNLSAAFAGGWWLSRELGADRLPAMIGGAALCTAPFLSAMVTFGFTECLQMGLLALHAAALIRLAKTGELRFAALSCALLALYAYSGWYMALFGLFAMPVLLGLCAVQKPSRRTWLLILAQGAVAAVLVCPAVYDFLVNDNAGALMGEREIPVFAKGRVAPGAPPPDWRHGLDFGTDPLNYVLPTWGGVPLPRSVYVGLVALLLGLSSLRHKTGRVLWLGVATFWVLGVGHWVTLAGEPPFGADRPWSAPVAWMTGAVDGLRAIQHWYRAGGMALVFLAPAAALAVPKMRWGAVALAGLVAADGLLLGDAPWPRLTHPGEPPAGLTDVPGEGPMLLLPFAEGARDGIGRTRQRWLPYLARPLAENYEGPDALMDNGWVAWAHHECTVRYRKPQTRPADPSFWIDQLHVKGLQVVAVVKGSSTWDRCEPALTGTLGPPDEDGQYVAWWAI
jgi:hypothetical protein